MDEISAGDRRGFVADIPSTLYVVATEYADSAQPTLTAAAPLGLDGDQAMWRQNLVDLANIIRARTDRMMSGEYRDGDAGKDWHGLAGRIPFTAMLTWRPQDYLFPMLDEYGYVHHGVDDRVLPWLDGTGPYLEDWLFRREGFRRSWTRYDMPDNGFEMRLTVSAPYIDRGMGSNWWHPPSRLADPLTVKPQEVHEQLKHMWEHGVPMPFEPTFWLVPERPWKCEMDPALRPTRSYEHGRLPADMERFGLGGHMVERFPGLTHLDYYAVVTSANALQELREHGPGRFLRVASTTGPGYRRERTWWRSKTTGLQYVRVSNTPRPGATATEWVGPLDAELPPEYQYRTPR